MPGSVGLSAPPTTAAALARAFLVETEADPRPWPDLFGAWADARDLDGGELLECAHGPHFGG